LLYIYVSTGVSLAVVTGPFVPQVFSIEANKLSSAVTVGL